MLILQNLPPPEFPAVIMLIWGRTTNFSDSCGLSNFSPKKILFQLVYFNHIIMELFVYELI